MVVVDPRKIGGTGVSFTLGCNLCTWEATFGPGQEAPFDNVENAGKARRVHCGANAERMSGVSRCPGLKQGDDVPEVPQSGLKKQPVYCRPADGVWGRLLW